MHEHDIIQRNKSSFRATEAAIDLKVCAIIQISVSIETRMLVIPILLLEMADREMVMRE